MSTDERRGLSRRQLLRAALVGTGAAAMAGLLTACVGGGGTETPPGGAASPAGGGTTGGARVELNYWDWWVTQGPTIDAAIQRFQQANPTIAVKKTTNAVDQYSDLFALAQRGGNGPDVFLIPQKPGFSELVANGWLADLAQFPDYPAFVKTFPQPEYDFVEGANVIGGKTYSAPFTSPAEAMWNQLWFNTKVFQDAGIVDAAGNASPPQTLDELLDRARTIKQRSNGQVYGWGFGGTTDTVQWLFWLAQLSGVDNGNGGLDLQTGRYSYGSKPPWAAALEALVTLRDEGLVLPDSASVDDEAIRVLFAQHRFGMMLSGTWVINGWQKTNPDFTQYNLTHMPLIGTPQPASYYYTGPGGTLFGLNAKSRHLDAAWQWFKFLYSREMAELWVKNGNGLSVFPDANKPEYLANDAMRNFAAQGQQYVRVGPQIAIRNPDTAKVKPAAVKPAEPDLVKGVYTGQIKDVSQALKDLDAAKQQALTQAIADARAAGANVSLDDYIFADWDPTKDYITKPKA